MVVAHVEPSFEVLTPVDDLRRQLLTIERSGRTCYRSDRPDRVVDEASASAFARMLIGRGHESVLEHSSLVVAFDGVSRGLTHELVRHRIAAFSQESTRYVDPRRFGPVRVAGAPPGRFLGGAYLDALDGAAESYALLRETGWPPEDARQVLPTATCARIVASANLREWRHIFRMRCDAAAHWEVRTVLCRLLDHLRPLLPGILDDFVALPDDGRGVPVRAWRMPDRAFEAQAALRGLDVDALRERLALVPVCLGCGDRAPRVDVDGLCVECGCDVVEVPPVAADSVEALASGVGDACRACGSLDAVEDGLCASCRPEAPAR